jgi:hypothetical protein
MKRIFPLGLLALLVIGCSSQTSTAFPPKVNEPETSAPTPIAQSTSSPNSDGRKPTPQSQNVYSNAKFGFWFGYPNGYVVDNSNENSQPKPGETLQGTIEIWESAIYQAIQAGKYEGGTEYPPNINISVHSNPDRLPLSQWQDKISIGTTNVRPTTVAGQDAIAYSADGLYASDNVLLSSPDGQSVIHLNRQYHNVSDPSRQAFQQIVSSLRFN